MKSKPTVRVNLRLGESEKKSIERSAEKCDLTIGQYLRALHLMARLGAATTADIAKRIEQRSSISASSSGIRLAAALNEICFCGPLAFCSVAESAWEKIASGLRNGRLSEVLEGMSCD